MVGYGAIERMAEGHLLIDVRTPGEFYRASPPPRGARLIPLPDLSSRCGAWDRTIPILLVCDTGDRSWRGALQLAQQGFQNVRVLSGGLLGEGAEVKTPDRGSVRL
jgi:rhodanese-related sulfurtransferase